jgi:hypothetical protein
MPVMLFRAVGNFVLRAFWQSLPRPAVRLFGMKANQNNSASKRGKRKHQRPPVLASTLHLFLSLFHIFSWLGFTTTIKVYAVVG